MSRSVKRVYSQILVKTSGKWILYVLWKFLIISFVIWKKFKKLNLGRTFYKIAKGSILGSKPVNIIFIYFFKEKIKFFVKILLKRNFVKILLIRYFAKILLIRNFAKILLIRNFVKILLIRNFVKILLIRNFVKILLIRNFVKI